MQLLNFISNNYFFLIILSFILIGIIINIITKMLLKTGSAVTNTGKGIITTIYNTLIVILGALKDLLAILFTIVVLFIACIINRRKNRHRKS